MKLGKNSVKQIAKLLPHIETFDVGYYDANVKAKDCDLMALTEHFTNLNSVRTDMWNVTNHGIMSVARAMGEQLLDLRIKGDTITDHYLSGTALETITASCCNLEYFAYRVNSSSQFYKSYLDGVTGDRIIALVEGCRRLKAIELYKALHVKKGHFAQIANMVAGELDQFALRKIVAVGYGQLFETGDYPFLRIEDNQRFPFLERSVNFAKERDSMWQEARVHLRLEI